jgi:hypothetical protein
MLERLRACLTPDGAKALADPLYGVERSMRNATTRSQRARASGECAMTAKAYDDSATAEGAPAMCTFTADERARNTAALAAYYDRRTAPRPTGDATLDRGLADLAAARDRACACTDVACSHQVDPIVLDAIHTIPRELAAATEDSEAMIDEVARCAQRLEDAAERARSLIP